MKLYRSIEYSRLTFLIDEEHQYLWKTLDENAHAENNYSNWWLKEDNRLPRHQMIKNVVAESSAFFEKSADFNSKMGGRFNPAKSFGAIYASSCPTLSMLEVLFHLFSSSLGLYNNLKKSSDKLTSSFNVPVPEKIEVLITAMELEIYETEMATLCESNGEFRQLCTALGFSRYIDEHFNEDFMFGNNYEITNILGCYLHSTKMEPLKAPSARIALEEQNNGKFNVIIPEKLVSSLNPALTGKFREYVCVMDMEEKHGKHKISIRAEGAQSQTSDVYLQSKPSKANGRIKSFSQIDDSKENKKRYSRDVYLQRYVV
jgi:hypothetical protein